jgi:YD repeat-containing protein
VGNGVFLTFNGGNVTLHGPSGFSAPYEADSNSYGGYAEPPGLDATLLQSSVNGASYVLIFQKTSECLGFNSGGQELFDQDKNGHQITFAYNSSGNLSSITDTQNRLTTFGYNASGQLNLITDPIGRTVQLSYQNGVPTTITDLNGKSTTLAYSGTDLTSITTPDSNTTVIGYQSSGNRVNQLTDALNKSAYLAYYSPGASQCGRITQYACMTFKDANNHTTIYGYAGLQVQQVVDGNGNLATTTYTPDANVATYTDPLNDITTFGFDSTTNNLTSVTDATNAEVKYDYDTTNPYLPNKVTDAQGNSISYTYDSNGNLLSATDTTSGGTGSSASYTYNTSGVSYGSYLYGLLTQVKDGDSNVTSYSYDSYGNLQAITPPSPLGQESITVDGVSRISSVTDGNGVTAPTTSDCHRQLQPRRLRVGLLHGIEAFEFDARIRRAELPVHRADSLVTMILPTLNLLTEVLNGSNIVSQPLPRQHTEFNFGNIEPARMFGGIVDL